MSMAQNAYPIFKSSRVETKRAILNILLSNLKIKDKQISYNLRKPFDLIDSLNEKTPPKIGGVAIGDAYFAVFELKNAPILKIDAF